MVEFLSKHFQIVPQRDEVKDVLVLVQRSRGFGADTIVVAVQPFADVAVERNKMRRAKDELIILDGNVIVRNVSVCG